MTEKQKAAVWISKYALSQGIYQQDIEICDADTVVARPGEDGRGYMVFYHKGEWHRTRGEAAKKAEEMRKKRIQSLRKQLEKLEELRFDESQN